MGRRGAVEGARSAPQSQVVSHSFSTFVRKKRTASVIDRPVECLLPIAERNKFRYAKEMNAHLQLTSAQGKKCVAEEIPFRCRPSSLPVQNF